MKVREFEKKNSKLLFFLVLVNEVLFSPIFLGVLTALAESLQFKSMEEIKKSTKEAYGDILIMNYKIWPIAGFLNFFYMPLKYQVCFNSLVALSWNTYFSYKVNTNTAIVKNEKLQNLTKF